MCFVLSSYIHSKLRSYFGGSHPSGKADYGSTRSSRKLNPSDNGNIVNGDHHLVTFAEQREEQIQNGGEKGDVLAIV